MKTILIGTLTEVMPVEVKETYKQQKLTIVVQEYNRDTGEPMKREVFQPVLFNKHVDSANAKALEGKRVRATCWLRSYETEKDQRTFYNLALNCSEIKEA